MSSPIIRVENLSKKYIVNHRQEGYTTFRDALTNGARSLTQALFNRQESKASSSDEEFWALKDVNFEIQQGDRVGIIGRNGAGKSTLLKILSRITEPTSGSIRIQGRVASLLEVGTGFHPELTGRENIFLNGAILGMSKVEITRKFDEIVDFAEVARFLDTPVKRYSSGMYVRLAFAVAAHLEPEILIVDEVLAVGDANFQKKCIGKMQDISNNQGRTILFVSHNIDAVQRLCSKCIMMERGQVLDYSEPNHIITRYLSTGSHRAFPNEWFDLSDAKRSFGNCNAHFVAAQYSSLNEETDFQAYPDGALEFLLAIESDESRKVGSLAVAVYDQTGNRLVNADSLCFGETVKLQQGKTLVKVRIEQLHLKAGTFAIGFWLANPQTNQIFDYIESAFEIQVVDFAPERFGAKPLNDGIVSCHFSLSVISQTVGLMH
jgi:lipopolysaccharide transport system ATP-binding protein